MSYVAIKLRCCLIAVALATLSVGLAIPLMLTYLETGLVPRLPTAVLAALLSAAAGFVLDTVTRGRREMKLLAYLGISGPGKNIEKE